MICNLLLSFLPQCQHRVASRQSTSLIHPDFDEHRTITACKWILQLLRSALEQMLEAANWAPTHGRTEPWRFVVLGADALQEMISLTQGVRITLLLVHNYAAKTYSLSKEPQSQ